MSDLFDLTDISDIPPELIQELNLASDIDVVILGLFEEAKKPLNLNELLIGYYRKYKENKTRQYMMTTCYRLVKKGFLEPAEGKGTYKYTEKGLSILKASSGSSNGHEEEDYDVLD